MGRDRAIRQGGYRLERPIINGRKSSSWYVVWTERGRSRRRSTGSADRQIAERFLAEYVAAMSAPASPVTVAELIAAYTDARAREWADPKRRAQDLKPVVAGLGSLSISSLTKAQIRLYSRGRSCGRATIDKELRLLRAALTWAQREGLIESAPHIDTPGGNAPRRRYLTQDEFAALYKACTAAHVRTFLALAIWTAQRAGAILRLRWEHIDEARGIVWYPPGVSRLKESVPVPIAAPLAFALGAARETARTPWVIEYRDERVADVSGAVMRAAAAAGLVDFRIHDLRRTAASWLLRNGASMEQVAALLGDSVEIVQRHYAHFSPGFLPVDSIWRA